MKEKKIEKRRNIDDSLTSREDINNSVFYGCFHFAIANIDKEILYEDPAYDEFYRACGRNTFMDYSVKDIMQLYLYCQLFKNSLPTEKDQKKQRKEQQKLDAINEEELQLINLMIPLFSPYKPVIEVKAKDKGKERAKIDDPTLIEKIKNHILSKYKKRGFHKKPISIDEAKMAIEQEENYQWVNAYKDKSSVQFLMVYDIDTFNNEMVIAYADSHKKYMGEKITYNYLLERKKELESLKPDAKRGAGIKTEEHIKFALKLGYIIRFHKFMEQNKYPTIQEYLNKEPLISKEYRVIYELLTITNVIEKPQNENTTTPEKYLRTRVKSILSKHEIKHDNLSTENYLDHLRSYLRNETNFAPSYMSMNMQTINYPNYTIE